MDWGLIQDEMTKKRLAAQDRERDAKTPLLRAKWRTVARYWLDALGSVRAAIEQERRARESEEG